MAKTKVNIFAGRATRYLAEKIAEAYGQELGKVTITSFSDGEFQPSFEETVRGNDLFLIQSTFAPVDNLFELLLMIDAAKRASAKRIVAVIPYFGFARQDRKDKPRVSIGAKLVTDLLTSAGVQRIVTMDLHSDQIQGFFNLPVDHLYASSIFIPHLKKLNLPNLTMASPDTGGTKRAAAYAKFLNTELVICFKQRSKANQVDKMTVIGDVEGKDIVLVDDIIDTGGTICKAADLMMDQGANSVRALCTHPVFSGNAFERIHNSKITELLVTDTIPRQETEKIKVLSTASIFADVIGRIHKYKSISSHFEFTTQL
ncbi:MAG: ribose-phosphate pyrophosphokinase [Bacteroidetes bacterium GWE2_42_24]|nr:MAG: ribose-phosphate pyrophosphokinase [Bacteroidetes bacterium GWE2_42_24]OFY25447.1 MAG: ribose-phosphate pyrophosphokinase [Bacteroidetes bacterium GWF2_43_11]PKP17508.1 MAG: ribose-phosphate pyrophosphokinase [Bacteroidetes bacterium HGW-Bacteroidetes-22]HCT84510.1 ribose-phosphate pyrophosphokinase [Candidatus Margulisiibacteriota bacterium]